MSEDFLRQLAQGLSVMGHGAYVTEAMQQDLLIYMQLLQKWGKTYNLTRILDLQQMCYKHILDSLSLLSYMPDDNSSVLDVGSGAGLPGLALAIVRPNLEFNLIDSCRKKVYFLQHVIHHLQLKHVQAHAVRVESFHLQQLPSTIISRAFAHLDVFVRSCAHLCNANTVLIAMKGQNVESLTDGSGFKVLQQLPVCVPGLEAKRCLVFLQKEG